ncbi:hypothetical protein HAX54_025856 [Datura stramonium]|uniref:Uncharacterized protein n=1 Tax=Datura stramonium TaxID=4076 RepID=A0ABS8V0E7_DATST|nr:hypothetical protein [Datura stramonium]
MISNFEADVKCLQDPSLISQFFSLSDIEKVPQLYSFWKWGALFLAIFATFSSLIRRIKLIFIYLRRIKPSAEPLLQYLSEDFDFSDDDDECSSVSSNDEELTPTIFSRDQQPVDRDFSVAGSSFYFSKQGQKSNLRLRWRRSSYERIPLTEFIAGKSVVRLWDLNKEQKMSNFWTSPSPAIVFSSYSRDDKKGTVLAAYDARMRRQSPAICAEWGKGKVLGIGGIEKLYVKDEVARILKIGDMRKAKSPVETVTVLDGDMWLDAGAVIIDDDFVDCLK